MFFLPTRYLNFLLIMMLAGGLAACATTDTGSETVIEDSSIDSAAPAESEAGEEAVAVSEEPMQFDETAPADEMEVTPEAFEEYSVEAYDVETVDDAATASAQQPEVQAVEEFPIQRYEIDEPREVQGVDETDAEIDRLRQELAATESELERIRAEEEQQDYATSETLASAESSADDMGSAQQQEETMTAQPSEQPSPTRGTSDLPGMPTENSIYFGYNQAVVDQQFESVLFAHAEFLKANPGMRVEIQGNCDERGSREYNIALGQRRALTVKRALELLGVEGYRINTVSFGSEKPVAFGHDEASWRQNRRADIVY